MTLLEAQQLHFQLSMELGTWLLDHGYQAKWGQTLRTIEEAVANAQSGKGIYHSLHLLGLAIDILLFKDGVYLKGVEDYRPLGNYWKSLHPLCCWGGDFASPDADHFSITWQGVK